MLHFNQTGSAVEYRSLTLIVHSDSNTRNHYLHSFFPQSLAYSSCDGERIPHAPTRPKMESRQAPRHIRLRVEEEDKKRKLLADKLKAQEISKKLATHAEQQPEGRPQAAAVPLEDGGFEIVSDGKLETDLREEEGREKVENDVASNKPVKSLREQALAKLLRQPSTPPLLERTIDFSLPSFDTTAPSAVQPDSTPPAATSSLPTASTALPSSTPNPLPPLEVQCRVRTRIPTPHGHVFLHLYTNNHDTKEHLAFVADHAQMASTSVTTNAVEGDPILSRSETTNRPLPFIRSRSLDAKWHEKESDEERIIRGAYVGRLSATSQIASTALGPLADYISSPSSPSSSISDLPAIDPTLVRIHSECFTGETIGSQRCDCGEQLDEAFRLITTEGRGVVVYLRQEGRGIGLLEKMRAYNLQDLGHDTVTANLMLGHGADLRTYGIAGGILRDLGVAGDEGGKGTGGVRLLTNNPDKITQIEKEGVRVAERVAMVPRSWVLAEREEARRRRHRHHHHHHLGKGTDKKRRSQRRTSKSKSTTSMNGSTILNGSISTPDTEEPYSRPDSVDSSAHLYVDPSRSPSPSRSDDQDDEDAYYSSSSQSDDDEDNDNRSESSAMYQLRHSGVGMIGRSTTASPELDKYLRTKIERMGHMLVAPSESSSTTASRGGKKGVHPLSESTTSLSPKEGSQI